MSVSQFAEHVAQHLKQLQVGHLFVHAYLIFIIYSIPVESVLMLFVVEEAVVLVDNLPQRLQIALRRIGVLLLVYTRGSAYAK